MTNCELYHCCSFFNWEILDFGLSIGYVCGKGKRRIEDLRYFQSQFILLKFCPEGGVR